MFRFRATGPARGSLWCTSNDDAKGRRSGPISGIDGRWRQCRCGMAIERPCALASSYGVPRYPGDTGAGWQRRTLMPPFASEIPAAHCRHRIYPEIGACIDDLVSSVDVHRQPQPRAGPVAHEHGQHAADPADMLVLTYASARTTKPARLHRALPGGRRRPQLWTTAFSRHLPGHAIIIAHRPADHRDVNNRYWRPRSRPASLFSR